MFFSVKNKMILINEMALFIVLLISACDTSTNNPNTIVFPSKNISYYNQVSPFFDEQCYCHRTGGSALDKIDVSTPEKIEDLYWTRFLKPGDPAGSDLYLVMKYPDIPIGYPQMPYGLAPVNSNQQNGIKQWIVEGARVDE